MKTLFKRLAALFGLSALFSTFSMAAAAAPAQYEVTGVNTFVDIMTSLAGGKVGLFLIVIIVGFSVYNAWKNANVAALLWGVFASVVIAALVPYATSIIDWASNLTF